MSRRQRTRSPAYRKRRILRQCGADILNPRVLEVLTLDEVIAAPIAVDNIIAYEGRATIPVAPPAAAS